MKNKIAKKVIRLLESRGGFDHWWDEIDEESKGEIIAELSNLLEVKEDPEQPLRVDIGNKVLSISIGIETLAWSLENEPGNMWPGDNQKFKVTDHDGFAKDVRAELILEEEDGTMPIHFLLDEAMKDAVENGTAYAEEVK